MAASIHRVRARRRGGDTCAGALEAETVAIDQKLVERLLASSHGTSIDWAPQEIDGVLACHGWYSLLTPQH